MPVTESVNLPNFDDYTQEDKILENGDTLIEQHYTLNGELVALVEIFYMSGPSKRIPYKFVMTDYTKSE